MRNSMKVAKWEIKRNMKNKTYLIGLFLTPIFIVGFMFLGSIFGNDSDEANSEAMDIFIHDQLNVYSSIEEAASGFNWNIHQTDIREEDVAGELESSENTAYLFLTNEALKNGIIPVYTSEETVPFFFDQLQVLKNTIKAHQMEQLGLSSEQLAVISSNITFEKFTAQQTSESEQADIEPNISLNKIIPGAFAGFIFLSIVFTGMAIFQSASQEKKDKIAEIILSSITPTDLMQGKIIGYFVLGIIQTIVSIIVVLPVVAWRMDLPIWEHLFVPELLLFIFIAILGYLLFASIFVGIGATMSDISTAGNFQGLVMMLPFATFIFIGPVISDPSGMWAQIGSYIPFTSSGVLLLRLSILDSWPWVEIIISLAILIVSILLFMKLAGKIFKVGILMYGKNATPGEIWKWIRA
ncbi:ABC transporter permease [Oceanobacillus senegalensis]|uniref:ABC transporter permease n=1 Tax=Oceanobacillus senegalensis TaxID=1936063 RepID=UPI000A308A05|nr:ABC transporter permease [Oceanobacillus senegalensis]